MQRVPTIFTGKKSCTSPGNDLKTSYSDDVNALKDYIIQFWDILSPRRPKLCLSILTSQYKSRISEDRKLRIIEEVLAALKSTDAWLINNGLNVTFNVLLGQELSKVSTNYFGDDTEFTPPKTIGVCPWGSICGRNHLMNNNNRINYVEYNVNSENEEPTTHPLLPSNSHLIFVDDGYRRDEVSVAKTGFRAKFEKMISEPAKKNVLNVPLVDLVIGDGGPMACLSERICDPMDEKISARVEHCDDPPSGQVQYAKLPRRSILWEDLGGKWRSQRQYHRHRP
ncbi:unnamed protein product [Schistocephalus solidus]|uniref:LSDAT_euk domain-containing protein n=1 Tax=Schistocephalus solidus TaxID=70667 RepID=A0A183ST25_SCHSO|nr:unnamed protein product [Schistocephalus solidus]